MPCLHALPPCPALPLSPHFLGPVCFQWLLDPSVPPGAVSASQLDIAPKHAGAVFGAGNTAATLAGFLAVPLTGLLLDKTDSWTLVFGVTAVHYVAGAVVWAAWCGDKPLPEDDL